MANLWPDREWLLDDAPKLVTIVDERCMGLGADFSGKDKYELTEWRIRSGAEPVAIASEEIERAWSPIRGLF